MGIDQCEWEGMGILIVFPHTFTARWLELRQAYRYTNKTKASSVETTGWNDR